MATGDPETREFYDRVGWQRTQQDARLVDLDLFGVKEDGPIRREIYASFLKRVQDVIRAAGDPMNILECGCGGNPNVHLLRDGDRYTGVDFSTTGLAEAEKSLREWGGEFRLQEADICRLPFSDGEFDAVYSAHVLYHIDNPSGQEAALGEIARVLRPGGAAVLTLANPRPVLFPARFGMRLVADLPVLGTITNRLRKKGPIPYRPMTIGWYKRQLRRHGSVQTLTGGIASTWFNQKVTEYRYPGKGLWKAIHALDSRAPGLSSYLGNYFLLIFRKS